jgi:hypothetical protein
MGIEPTTFVLGILGGATAQYRPLPLCPLAKPCLTFPTPVEYRPVPLAYGSSW